MTWREPQAVLWREGSTLPEREYLEREVRRGIAATDGFRFKPRYGLWTSTYDEDHVSDWARYCRLEHFDGRDGPQELFVLTPDPDANVYVVNDRDDVRALYDRFGVPLFETSGTLGYASGEDVLDWPKIAQTYDAVHLTYAGLCETNMGRYALYAWDSESTVWFAWRFTDVERRGLVDLGAMTFAWED